MSLRREDFAAQTQSRWHSTTGMARRIFEPDNVKGDETLLLSEWQFIQCSRIAGRASLECYLVGLDRISSLSNRPGRSRPMVGDFSAGKRHLQCQRGESGFRAAHALFRQLGV